MYGGLSSEKEISVKTGKAMLKALEEKGYDAYGLEAKRDFVSQLLKSKPDVIVNALHGKLGEDGAVQGVFEWLSIPYTGSGVMSSAIAMNKILTKQVARQAGILTPDFMVFHFEKNSFETFSKNIQVPCVVKAQAEGSTVGTSIVKQKAGLKAAIDEASKYDSHILIEDFVAGKEITVPVVNGKAYSLIEIAPKSGFYDYTSKYTKGATEYIMPARVSEETHLEVKRIAVEVYDLLQCRGCARVDFMVDAKGTPWFIEINTLPGMTETSLVPKSCAYDGLDFNDLVEEILKGARLDHEKILSKSNV